MRGAQRHAACLVLMGSEMMEKAKKLEAAKPEAELVMKKLNDTNWQYLVRSFDIGQEKQEVKPYPDFECILIGSLVSDISNYLFAPKKVRLDAIGVKANLYSMISEDSKGKFKVLDRAPDNDRDTRHRPESTQKYGAVTIAMNRDFAKEVGEFGKTYIR